MTFVKMPSDISVKIAKALWRQCLSFPKGRVWRLGRPHVRPGLSLGLDVQDAQHGLA